MVLVIIIAIAYKVVSKQRERRRMIDLPMQVLGIEDENTDPVLVILGESLSSVRRGGRIWINE